MKYLVPILLVTGLLSCKPAILFTEPQPPGKKDLKTFPARYQGDWLEEDSSLVLVQSTRILERYQEDLAHPISEILEDEDIELRKGQIWSKELNMGFPVEIRDDSLFGTVVIYDTLVDLSGRDHLRKLGRHFFVSLPADSLWMVYKIRFHRREAWSYAIRTDDELSRFRAHTSVMPAADETDEPDNYTVHPSLKEFRKLVKDQTFTDTTHYLRLRRD